MNIFIFAGNDANGDYTQIGIDLSKSSYQRKFDCSTEAKAKASLGAALAEDQMGEAVLIDLRSPFIDLDKLNQSHFHTMGNMYNNLLDVPAASQFKTAYLAYADSVCFPDRYFLSNQEICRTSAAYVYGEVHEFYTLEEGRKLREKFIAENNLGISTDLGGEVFKGGSLVGYIGFNGSLLSDVPYGGRDTAKLITDFLTPQ